MSVFSMHQIFFCFEHKVLVGCHLHFCQCSQRILILTLFTFSQHLTQTCPTLLLCIFALLPSSAPPLLWLRTGGFIWLVFESVCRFHSQYDFEEKSSYCLKHQMLISSVRYRAHADDRGSCYNADFDWVGLCGAWDSAFLRLPQVLLFHWPHFERQSSFPTGNPLRLKTSKYIWSYAFICCHNC